MGALQCNRQPFTSLKIKLPSDVSKVLYQNLLKMDQLPSYVSASHCRVCNDLCPILIFHHIYVFSRLLKSFASNHVWCGSVHLLNIDLSRPARNLHRLQVADLQTSDLFENSSKTTGTLLTILTYIQEANKFAETAFSPPKKITANVRKSQQKIIHDKIQPRTCSLDFYGISSQQFDTSS